MRKFNMKNARVLYRKGIHNFEPRTPYGMGGKLVYKDSGEVLPCPPYCAGKIFKTEELENMRDPSRTRQFYNEGIKKGIDLGGNADMSKFYINPEENYINTTSTGIPGTVDANLKRINQMYLSNNRQIPELTPTDRKNILDEMNKRSFDYQSSDDKIINKYFKSIKRNSGYMTAQLGKHVYPEYEDEIRNQIRNQTAQFRNNQNVNNMLNERLGDYYKGVDQFEINKNINNMLNEKLLNTYKSAPLTPLDEKLINTFKINQDVNNMLNKKLLNTFKSAPVDNEAPYRTYESPFLKNPRMRGQLGTQVEPTTPASDFRPDPFAIYQSEKPEPAISNDMYNRAYNIKYDLQGKPIRPDVLLEEDPFNPNLMEYNKALEDYYKSLENDPNNYSHMKKELRPKMRKPMRGYGGDLNYMKYGR